MERREEGGAARLLRMMEVLAAHPAGAPLQVLARECALPKSTAHRLLHSLAAAGYVRAAPGGRYELTLRLFSLCCASVHNFGPVAELEPRARALARRTGLTVSVSWLDGASVVTLLRFDAPAGPEGYIGQRRPLYCTAAGLAILATLPDEEAAALAGRFIPYTARTITGPEMLAARLKRVRALGYALEHAEYDETVHGVAVALPGPGGRAQAAMGAYGPPEQITEQVLAGLRSACQPARERAEGPGRG